MGDGFAIIPADGKICSPINGTVISIFKTKHAIGLRNAAGLEILLHLGLDTVELAGKPFALMVKENENVKKGQLLVKMDIEQIKAAGKDPIVITLVTTNNWLTKPIKSLEEKVTKGDAVAMVKAN